MVEPIGGRDKSRKCLQENISESNTEDSDNITSYLLHILTS